MKIRRYQDSDKSRIIELLRLNTPQHFSPKEEKDLLYYLNHQIEHYSVIEVDELIIGCGGFNLWVNGEGASISWDIVHPHYQGKGLGSDLTKFRIQKIKEIERIKSITVRTSQFAYAFYERFGFEVKETATDYWDIGFDLYKMERNINLISEDSPEGSR
ncbi:MAG TPA: GNAT family N-acetyltransferase [Sphingobacteriaceae bacterium]|nr:GNAT family N-acetyltransferase [Sphingobacteriaceae bacterium]